MECNCIYYTLQFALKIYMQKALWHFVPQVQRIARDVYLRPHGGIIIYSEYPKGLHAGLAYFSLCALKMVGTKPP